MKFINSIIIKMVFIFGIISIIIQIISPQNIKELIRVINNYLLSNQIFTAIIGGILINYLWRMIESEHKRYDSLVYLERLFGENYNILRNNKSLINCVFDHNHLVFQILIFQELIPIDREKIMKIKYLDYINSDVVGLLIMIDSYNRLISEYAPFLRDIKNRLFDEANKNEEHGNMLNQANQACLRQLEEIQKKTIEMINLSRIAFAKATVLAKEDRPWLVRMSLLTALLRKGGKEILDEKQAEDIIKVLVTQEEKCDTSVYSELSEKCKQCDIQKECKRYFQK